MHAPTALLHRWLASDDAATAIEYAVLVTALALALVPVLTQLGSDIDTLLFGPVVSAF